jgi:hypothetical protein
MVDWIHTQQIHLTVHCTKYGCTDERPFARQPTKEETIRKAQACNEETTALVNLWILAGELLISKLQNHTINLLLKVARSCAQAFGPLYNRIYEKTDIDSPLREFVARLCAWNENFHEFENRPHLFPPAMLLDLARVHCQNLPHNVAVARRHNMQRSYIDFLVKEEYCGIGKPSYPKAESLLTDVDTTREASSDDTSQKHGRGKSSVSTSGWGPQKIQDNTRGTWDTKTEHRPPSGFVQSSRKRVDTQVGNLMDYTSPKKWKQSREVEARGHLKATNEDMFEPVEWEDSENGSVLVPDHGENWLGVQEPEVHQDEEKTPTATREDLSEDMFGPVEWEGSEKGSVLVPDRKVHNEDWLGAQELEAHKLEEKILSAMRRDLSEDVFGEPEWETSESGSVLEAKRNAVWIAAQDPEAHQNAEKLPKVTLGDSSEGLFGLHQSDAQDEDKKPSATPAPEDSSQNLICFVGAGTTEDEKKKPDTVVQEATGDLLGLLDSDEVEEVLVSTCDCMLICICRHS